ncbi:hypothetical protein HJG54_24980 [Leptolyngbya sp. NK1-12]|uniref:Uncharacterized protein n=1 Tax=Leptolyngbya sp. NK1-12 TaxID=2547451 RepID=A0AA97AIP5_9CYAN|nr:hypothetical protein [Leptolyngbya sp. NK1-12]WNZ25769.1 hypothetical protein HJG54_24980 [Leptolyngbya sp. NK1-12]
MIVLNDQRRDTKDFQEGQGVSAAHRAQSVVLPFDQGRVAVLGEAAMLPAQLVQTPDEGVFPMGMNRPGLDNEQFALNLMH